MRKRKGDNAHPPKKRSRVRQMEKMIRREYERTSDPLLISNPQLHRARLIEGIHYSSNISLAQCNGVTGFDAQFAQ